MDHETCQGAAIEEYESKGFRTFPTGRGSDFLVISPSGVVELVEVKTRNDRLTKLQMEIKRKAERAGTPYVEYRCP